MQNQYISKDYSILNIKMEKFEKTMFLSKETYISLQIFKEDVHPSLIKGKGKSKEGFSLYTLYENNLCNIYNKYKLKEWFFNPSFDKIFLEKRVRTVEFFHSFLMNNNQKTLEKMLKQIFDFKVICKKFVDVNSTIDNWSKLKLSLENSYQLLTFLQNLPNIENYYFLENIFQINLEPLTFLINLLQKYLKSDLKINQNFIINYGVNQNLDNKTKIFDSLDEYLSIFAENEMKKFPKNAYVPPFYLSYFPQLGYLVVVPKKSNSKKSKKSKNFNEQNKASSSLFEILEEEENEDGVEIIEENNPINEKETDFFSNLGFDWQFQFELENDSYYKNNFTKELDNEYGDLYGEIVDIQNKILQDLEEHIIENIEYLIDLSEFFAELDCFLAYAKIAINGNMVRPELTTENLFIIKNGIYCFKDKLGRNILLETVCNEKGLIHNDYFSINYIDDFDNDFVPTINSFPNKFFSNKLCILTGPNSSGKSIYLKQIGLIIFMAHIGSFIPVKFAKIGLVDKLLTVMDSDDSISNHENRINYELQTLSQVFSLATNRSFVLIDEPGNNTCPELGFSLFIKIVHYFSNKNFQINQYLQHNLNEVNQIENINEYDKNLKLLYCKIPNSIISTHFKDFFFKNYITENYIIRFLAMDSFLINNSTNLQKSLLTNKNDKSLEETCKNFDSFHDIIPLYKARPGFIYNSFGILLSKQFIDEKIITEKSLIIQDKLANGAEFQLENQENEIEDMNMVLYTLKSCF